MSAELVDPWADPPPERLKTADMRKDINGRIAISSQNDPALCPQLVQKTLRALQQAADDEGALSVCELSVWARWLLEQLHHRAVTGVEYDEPQEPAWSLDPQEREVPR